MIELINHSFSRCAPLRSAPRSCRQDACAPSNGLRVSVDDTATLAFLLSAKPRAAKLPVAGLFTQMRFHRIVFNVSDSLRVMVVIEYETLEGLNLPELSGATQNLVCFVRRVRLEGMQDG